MFDLDGVPYTLDDAVYCPWQERVDGRRWAVFGHISAWFLGFMLSPPRVTNACRVRMSQT
jgi:hypothetical protein